MPQYSLPVLLCISLGHGAALALQRVALRVRVHRDVPLVPGHVDALHLVGAPQHHRVQLAQLHQPVLVLAQALVALRDLEAVVLVVDHVADDPVIPRRPCTTTDSGT